MDDINALHISVLVVSGFLVILLLIYLLISKPAESGLKSRKKKDKSSSEDPTKPCPLCKAPLKQGETVHSVLFPGKPDSLMEIYGCPYCEHGSEYKRLCPVCKKEIPDGGFVIARVFEKPGKKHVHVLGCTTCYSGRTKINGL